MSGLTAASLTAFLATGRVDASRVFYRDTLGLQLLSEDDYALVFDSHGTHLRVQKVQSLVPHPFTSLGWHVDDIRETITILASRGVRFERYDFMEQDDLGVWSSPSGARVAWFKDPDGNVLSLTQ